MHVNQGVLAGITGRAVTGTVSFLLACDESKSGTQFHDINFFSLTEDSGTKTESNNGPVTVLKHLLEVHFWLYFQGRRFNLPWSFISRAVVAQSDNRNYYKAVIGNHNLIRSELCDLGATLTPPHPLSILGVEHCYVAK